jgi:hypothetical protein
MDKESIEMDLRAAKLRYIKEKAFITPGELALLVGISESKMGQLQKAGKGPAFIRMGGTWHIRPDVGISWFENFSRQQEGAE